MDFMEAGPKPHLLPQRDPHGKRGKGGENGGTLIFSPRGVFHNVDRKTEPSSRKWDG